MSIEILHRFTQVVLYASDLADVRSALMAAVGSGANLRGANFRGANLAGANFRGANLAGADLRGADLADANFRDADLSGANFRGANLRGAKLRGADLWGANLRGADLADANFRGADLRGADLTGANLRGANLADADLRDADLPPNSRIAMLCYGGWGVTVGLEATRIGCEEHTNTAWLGWAVDAPEIAAMHPDAPAWWTQHREAVCAVIRDVMGGKNA